MWLQINLHTGQKTGQRSPWHEDNHPFPRRCLVTESGANKQIREASGPRIVSGSGTNQGPWLCAVAGGAEGLDLRAESCRQDGKELAPRPLPSP